MRAFPLLSVIICLTLSLSCSETSSPDPDGGVDATGMGPELAIREDIPGPEADGPAEADLADGPLPRDLVSPPLDVPVPTDLAPGQDSMPQEDVPDGAVDGPSPDGPADLVPPQDRFVLQDQSMPQNDVPPGDGAADAEPGPQGDLALLLRLLQEAEANPGQAAELWGDFLREISLSGGLPVVEGAQVTFVYWLGPGLSEPVRVAGSFCDWDPDVYPMARVGGTSLFWATVDLGQEPGRLPYKFVAGDVWLADPESRRFQYDDFGEYSLIKGGLEASHLERYQRFWSPQLENERTVTVYLPAGYEGGGGTYPVLYMHDGQNLFSPEAMWGGWEVDDTIDALVAERAMEPIVVVGLDNTSDRMAEYTQVEDIIAPDGLVGGKAPLYAAFLVDVVRPFFLERYRLEERREATAILGSSLGGLVSFWMGQEYPEVFRLVGGMSSTFGWGSLSLQGETILHIYDDRPLEDQVFYLDSGGGDMDGCPDTDGDGVWDDSPSGEDNYCETKQMQAILEGAGYQYDSTLWHYWDPWAEHNEAAWLGRMPLVLPLFFPPN